jgi:glucose-6-phosphate isomerase, archaeal
VKASSEIVWEPNPRYGASNLEQRAPRRYPELGLDPSRSLYRQFVDEPDSVLFVPDPQRAAAHWATFVP